MRGIGQSALQAITPNDKTPPATMAGVSIPPDGAELPQLQFRGPLLGTGPMFGVRGAQQPAPQPSPQPYNYGLFAATSGLPSFDVSKTQTPSSQTQIGADFLTGKTSQLQFAAPTQNAITYSKAPEERMATATPYGNIDATFQSGNSGPRQLENFNARETAYVGRTPEQQQALLAQVRANGAQLANKMQNFGESRIPAVARVDLAAPQGRFGQPLTGLFPQSTEGIAQRKQRGMT